MAKTENLRQLVTILQASVKAGGMTSAVVSSARQSLATIGYKYDLEKYPPLSNTELFVDESAGSPRNLAEALLWKLGKWKSYKKFARQFTEDDPKPSGNDVVFFAFARHLKHQQNPIYDQHTIRAMWAICDGLSADEKNRCKNLLLKKNEKWKATGSGGSAVACYTIFLRHIGEIVKAGATKREIDLLLMPLGQALRERSANYREFRGLCGWSG